MPTNYRETQSFAEQIGQSKGASKEDIDLYGKLITWLRDGERSTPETEYRKISAQDIEFYAGRQDSDEVIEALTQQKRPIEVYNEVKPKVDMLVGLGAQMKQEYQVIPVGAEDEPLAELMNGVLKFYRNKLDFSTQEMEAFEQFIKGGRGLMNLYVDAENPFEPKIKVKFYRGHQFIIDPDFTEYDLSDARYLFVDVWLTEDDIRQKFPDFKGEEVKSFGLNASSEYPEFWNEAKEKYRVVEGWYRKTEPGYWYISPFTGEPDFVKKKDRAAFLRSIDELNAAIERGEEPLGPEMTEPIPDVSLIDGYKNYTYYAIFSGSGILEKGENPYSHEDFPFVFFGAYRDDNKNNWFGVVTMMKDPQRGLNTMRRQLMHLLQTSPKGILLHESGSILNIEEYEKRSADPTYHMELARDGLGRVKFTDQPQISPVYSGLDTTFIQSMKDSSGIQDSLLGIQTSSREPGVTVRMRQETGLAVLYIIFKNFAKSRQKLTKQLMKMVQQFVREPKLVRIEGPEGMQLLEINKEMNPQSKGFNDISAGRFDLFVEEGIESVTMRMAVSQWLTEFAQNNPGLIPPDVIMEYANIPFTVKQQVREYYMAQQQQEQEFKEAELALQDRELDIKEKAANNKGGEKK